MRSLHRGTVYYRVEENTSPSTVSETFMISIFAWVKIPYSKAQPLQQHFRHCTSKNCGRQRSRVRSRCSFMSPWFFSRIQVYASVYINGNLYSQHHIKQCKKKSETAAANIFQCKQNPGATSQLFPKPQSFNNINKTSQGQNPPPIHSQPPVETVEVQDLPRHHTWPRHRFVQCPVRVVKFGDGIKQNMNPTVSKVLLYILYIHIFATTYAKIHTTYSLLDTSLNLISKSKWRKPFEWQRNVIVRMLEPLTPHLSQGQV